MNKIKTYALLLLTTVLVACSADKRTTSPVEINSYPFSQSECPPLKGSFQRNDTGQHFSITSSGSEIRIKDRGVDFIVDGRSRYLDNDTAYAGTCKDSHIFIHIRLRDANQSGDDLVIFYTPNPLQRRKNEMIRGVIENGKNADLATFALKTAPIQL